MSFPSSGTGGGGGSGTSDTLESTQVLVKTAVQGINTKTPALGQALASGSVPVVLTAAQLTTLTPVSGLTDTELRATAVPVSLSGVSTSAKQDTLAGLIGEVQASPTSNTLLDRVKALLTGIVLSAGTSIIGKVGIDQTTPGTTDSVTIKASVGIGSLTETAPTTDTASSGLNGRLQRIAQNLTSLITFFSPITTATLSNVSGSASSVTIIASNSSRRRLIIVNDSTANLYLKFGATASTTSYTVLLNAGDTYESPIFAVYTGIIDGIWSSATGSARITEMS